MRAFIVSAFDDVIIGTSTTWYTSASLNERLGAADGLVVHAVTTNVSGTGPTLTCHVEHSGDARHWLATQSPPEIDAQPISIDTSLFGHGYIFFPLLLKFVRVKVFLGGTSPQCRLKLHIAGRVSGANSGTAAAGAVSGRGDPRQRREG